MPGIYDLFTEYDTNNICVKDFGLTYNGALITNICWIDGIGDVTIWAGDPEKDKFAEELIIPKYDEKKIFEQIIDLM